MYNINGTWFFGVVEDRMDPLELGRVAVRVYGLHTDNKAQIPSTELHWAIVGMPVTSSSMNGIGDTPRLVEGTTVMGVFIDGDSMQQPVVMFSVPGIPQDEARPSVGFFDPRTELGSSDVPGLPSGVTYPGSGGTPVITEPSSRPSYPRPDGIDKPDISRLARNDDPTTTHSHISKSNSRRTGNATAAHTSAGGSDSAIAGGSWDEPNNPYGARYPYNRVIESESGNIIEIDDTPGAERFHVFHRSGSFKEYHPDGGAVNKTVGDNYSIFHSNDRKVVLGDQEVTVHKGHRLKVNAGGGSSSMVVEVGSGGNMSISVVGGNANLYVGGDINIKATGNLNQTITGNVTQTVTGNSTETITGIKTIAATGNLILQGAQVLIN